MSKYASTFILVTVSEDHDIAVTTHLCEEAARAELALNFAPDLPEGETLESYLDSSAVLWSITEHPPQDIRLTTLDEFVVVTVDVGGGGPIEVTVQPSLVHADTVNIEVDGELEGRLRIHVNDGLVVDTVKDTVALSPDPRAVVDDQEAEDDDESETTYRVVRFYRDDRPREIQRTGLTLEEAQSHCNDGNTHGESWFDGYEEE